MNVLIIAESYLSDNPEDYAGVFIHRQSLALSKLGYDFRVINPQPLFSKRIFSKYYPYESKRDSIVIYRPRFVYFPKIIKLGKTYDFFYSKAVNAVFKSIISSWKPDVVICDWIIPGGYAAYVISTRMNLPLIIRARGSDVRFLVKQSSKLKDYYRQIGDQAKLVICNGLGLKKDLLNSGIFDQNKIMVIPNGLDTDYFRPPLENERHSSRSQLGIPIEAQVWLFVGTWAEHKGTKEISFVIPELMEKFPDVYFLVAGKIIDQNSYNKFQNVQGRTKFLGTLSTEQIIKCYHASDLYVLPSHMEGLPNTLLEAMSCAIASIASSVGGIPSLIEDGVNGLLINKQSKDMLKKSLSLCYENKKLRIKLGKEARETIINNGYGMNNVISELNNLFVLLTQSNS